MRICGAAAAAWYKILAEHNVPLSAIKGENADDEVLTGASCVSVGSPMLDGPSTHGAVKSVASALAKVVTVVVGTV